LSRERAQGRSQSNQTCPPAARPLRAHCSTGSVAFARSALPA